MATTYITRTTGTSTNVDKCTFSGWIKRSYGTSTADEVFMGEYTDASNRGKLIFAGDMLHYFQKTGGSTTADVKTTRVFRDQGAWYHIVVAFDSTQVTDTDRIKFYINGVQETLFTNTSYPSSGQNIRINESSAPIFIGQAGASASYFSGEMSHVQFVDGLQLAPTEFGEVDSTSGIWKIKTTAYATPGTNGFFLKMEDRTNLDLDSSSNAHTFTTTGTLTATYDNPSNNFATWNPLMPNHTPANNATYSNGNTSSITTATGGLGGMSSQGSDVSKWYAEIKMTSESTGGASAVGVYKNPGLGLGANSPHDSNKFYGVRSNGTKLTATVGSGSWGASYSAGDILSLALDIDNDRLYIAKNGLWSDGSGSYDEAAPDAYVTLSADDTWFFGCGDCEGGGTAAHDVNFGNGYFGTTAVTSAEADDAGIGAFEYAPPTGYYALCTKNIKAYGG